MPSPLLSLILGQNNFSPNDFMNIIQNASLIEIAAQGYQAYQRGEISEFINSQYKNNRVFQDFYNKNKNKTLKEFLEEKNIVLYNSE